MKLNKIVKGKLKKKNQVKLRLLKMMSYKLEKKIYYIN